MTKLISLGLLFIPSFTFVPTIHAANLTFDSDTEIELTGLDQELYTLSGSEADSLEVSGSTLTVDIPVDSTFTLGSGTPTHKVLQITPTGGSVTLTLNSSNLSQGYIGGWTLNSTTAASWTILFGVSNTAATHEIGINGNTYNQFTSNAQGEVSFTYKDSFTNQTFTVATWTNSGGGGLSWHELQEYNKQLAEQEAKEEAETQTQEQLKARIRELQLEVIRLARQLITLLEERLGAASTI